MQGKKILLKLAKKLACIFIPLLLLSTLTCTSFEFFLDFPIVRFTHTFFVLKQQSSGSFYNKYNDFPVKKSNKNAEVVVFFIGESARGDHLALNGYQRNTTQYTQNIKNIMSFKDSIPCQMSTGASTPCMLHGNDYFKEYGQAPKQSSVITWFYHAGYDIYYISTGPQDVLDGVKFDIKYIKKIVLSKNALTQNYRKSSDLNLVTELESVLKIDEKPKFIVMNGVGSHYNYDGLVDVSYYEKIKDLPLQNGDLNVDYSKNNAPYCSLHKNKKYKDIVDWYDATILETDHVVANITKVLSNYNSLFLYASDHGESFGERGQPCVHGWSSKEIWNVAFIVWVSDKYIKLNNAKYNNIVGNYKKINNKTLPPATHGNIFHTLLQCSGIETGAINPDFSLCNKSMLPTASVQKCSRYDITTQECFYEGYEKYQ